ncbi:tyrosine-type recombinase/integrase [Micromonospora marina]|uniref:tyrosine-type recombinase/integrase n=1 Tax=Micromonospora marina TaxID=307120 RepID=UPI003D7279B5
MSWSRFESIANSRTRRASPPLSSGRTATGCSPRRPADRSTTQDYDEWKRLLRLAGLRDGRLHDARHTAATVLLILGVAERAVMGIMGWSNSALAARYQHLTTQARRDMPGRSATCSGAAPQTPGGLHETQVEAADDGAPDAARVRLPPTTSDLQWQVSI